MHRRNAISGSRQPLYRWFVGTRRTSSRSGRDGFGEDEGNRRTIDQTGRREIASGRRRRRSWRVAEEWPGSIVGGPGGWRAKGERRRVHVFGEPLRPVRDWPQPLQMHRALHCTALQLRLSPYVMPLRVLFRASPSGPLTPLAVVLSSELFNVLGHQIVLCRPFCVPTT